ncbi:facilitated trehalose transporter Tret1-like [Diaphorina citri]|uniref:Facilitated trehalose transporter Tret1-like n=1 Tax=Diaphorina citri TaxID=121845 RepID=A0A3Q0IHK1_DIACI|nr:facilitated trehalose transporter Tret1-like [Diaphorina citri]
MGLSVVLVDKAGRRLLLLLSVIIMGLCLGVLGFYFFLKNSGSDVSSIAFLPLISVIMFIVMFSLGFGPIPWMMVGELFAAEYSGAN